VIAFMLFYYRFAGLLADLAMIWNVLFLLAGLAASARRSPYRASPGSC
jgi:preprotein translocase subunit SecD